MMAAESSSSSATGHHHHTSTPGSYRDQFVVDLRQGKLRGSSYDLARASVNFMRKVIANGRYNSFDELIALLKVEGGAISDAVPTEFVVGNMVLRVLKLVREEQNRLVLGSDDVLLTDPYDSLHKLWKAPESEQKDTGSKQLRKAAIESVNELLLELENSRDNIASQAVDHIANGDVIFTLGRSATVESFLLGEQLLKNVEKETKSIPRGWRVIADTDVLPAMAQVTRIIVGASAVMANGGFVAPAGTLTICMAAKRHSVPVIVCAAFYKFTPKFLSGDDTEEFSRMQSPAVVLPATQAERYRNCDVYNPSFDYIPPELVTLFIPQTFGIAPSHIYRLLGEYFHPDDIHRSS